MYYSDIPNGPAVPIFLYMWFFCDSICRTMYRLLSRNRSTQFSRHDASPLSCQLARVYEVWVADLENFVLMLPVIHLQCQLDVDG
jgi:hypothetical protein